MARIDITNLPPASGYGYGDNLIIDQEDTTKRISVDILLGGHLPSGGGTLSGKLDGTSAQFSEWVSAPNIPTYHISSINPEETDGEEGDIWFKI